MRPALLAPLALLGAGAAEARFAPRTDVAYQLTNTAITNRDDTSDTLSLTREIRFAQHADAWEAIVTITATGANTATGAGALFDRAFAALKGVPMRITLDRAGAVTGVDDAAALWAHLSAALPADDAGKRVAAVFAAIPPEQRTAILASQLADIVAATDAERAAGTRQTTIPTHAYDGGAAALPATERVAVERRLVTIDIAAVGEAGGGTTSFTRRKVVDRATGLLRERHEDARTTAIVDGAAHVLHTLQDTTLVELVLQYPSGNPRIR